MKAAKKLKIDWSLHLDMNDAELNRRLYPAKTPAALSRFAQPDWVNSHHYLKRQGMTKQLLWEQYRQGP